MIGRREVITLLGGAAAAWPLAARAQQPAMPVIALVNARSPEGSTLHRAAFRKGLNETGYVEGQNVTVEYHWLEGQYDRLPSLMADLVSRRMAVIATPGSRPAALAAKAATTTIPIVYATGADPVQAGLAVSLNRPGSNLTGISAMNLGLVAKQLELLHQLLPKAARFAVLVNPSNATHQSLIADVQGAAYAMALQLEILSAATNRDIVPAFAEAVRKRADALLISGDPLFTSRQVQLATLAARHALPAIYGLREFTEAGGLISYGSSFTEMFRQAGVYTARILRGEKAADLPIQQATRFDFIINLQTAEVLGLDIPATLLALANEVIE